MQRLLQLTVVLLVSLMMVAAVLADFNQNEPQGGRRSVCLQLRGLLPLPDHIPQRRQVHLWQRLSQGQGGQGR